MAFDLTSRVIYLPQRELIINGKKAVKGRYPYFTTLGHFCGGALIAPDIVLMAGHCEGSRHDRAHYARVGTFSFRKDVKGVDYEEHYIDDQVRHPSWKEVGDDEFIHDFLLLKLRHPSSNPTIRINRHPDIPGPNHEVTAMGTGNTDPDAEFPSDVLMEVTLNAIPNEICEESFDEYRNKSYAGRIYPSMMCTTGGRNNERDAWYGLRYFPCAMIPKPLDAHFVATSSFLSIFPPEQRL